MLTVKKNTHLFLFFSDQWLKIPNLINKNSDPLPFSFEIAQL